MLFRRSRDVNKPARNRQQTTHLLHTGPAEAAELAWVQIEEFFHKNLSTQHAYDKPIDLETTLSKALSVQRSNVM